MLKRKHRWWIQYVGLLLVTALYYDWCFSTDGTYPLIARNSDGYGVVDLNTAKADGAGKVNMDTLQVGALTVTGSANLPASGTVPIHPIAGSHDTSATGAQLNTLVGGSASEASSLHNHASVSDGFYVPGNLSVIGRTRSGKLWATGQTSATESASLMGGFGQHGSQQESEYVRWAMDDNTASSDVTDQTGHWPGSLFQNGAYANTSQATTTTAVLGGRALWLTGYDGNKEQVYRYMPFSQAGRDFTLSFWHRPAKTALTVAEYPMHSGSTFYIALNTAGRYYCCMAPSGAPTFYVGTASGTNYYGTGFHHIVMGRQGTALFFFVDGVRISASDNPAYSAVLISGIRFGGVYGSTSMGRGVIDDCRVFRYGLSAGQIAALYNAGAGTANSVAPVTQCEGALSFPSRIGYVAEVRNLGNSSAYKGIKIQAGENTPTRNNEILGCYEGDGDQRGALVIDSSRNVVIWNLSDAAVKMGITPTTRTGTERLKRVPVYDYQYRSGGGRTTGFLAQDVAAAIPEASAMMRISEVEATSATLGTVVEDNGTTITLESGEKVSRDGADVRIIGTQVVRYDKKTVQRDRLGVMPANLIPTLWKTVQEQQTRIEALDARLTALEKRVRLP